MFMKTGEPASTLAKSSATVVVEIETEEDPDAAAPAEAIVVIEASVSAKSLWVGLVSGLVVL